MAHFYEIIFLHHYMDVTINQNLQENQKLSSLRNLLLPRLISGEIDVSNIDF